MRQGKGYAKRRRGSGMVASEQSTLQVTTISHIVLLERVSTPATHALNFSRTASYHGTAAAAAHQPNPLLPTPPHLDGFAEVAGVCGVLKGVGTHQHHVQRHAAAPHIRNLAVVLWGAIRWMEGGHRCKHGQAAVHTLTQKHVHYWIAVSHSSMAGWPSAGEPTDEHAANATALPGRGSRMLRCAPAFATAPLAQCTPACLLSTWAASQTPRTAVRRELGGIAKQGEAADEAKPQLWAWSGINLLPLSPSAWAPWRQLCTTKAASLPKQPAARQHPCIA